MNLLNAYVKQSWCFVLCVHLVNRIRQQSCRKHKACGEWKFLFSEQGTVNCLRLRLWYGVNDAAASA